MVLGSGDIGDARARVTVDTSQLFAAAADVQRAAQQIRDTIIQSMQGALTMTAATTTAMVAQNNQIQQAIQKTQQAQRAATKANTDAARDQLTALRTSIRAIDAMLAEVTAKVSVQQRRVRETTGPGTDKTDITRTMREYVSAINDAKVRLRELKSELASVVAAGGDGKALQKQINRLNDIVASFRGGWMDELKAKVDVFEGESAGGNRKAADQKRLDAVGAAMVAEEAARDKKLAAEKVAADRQEAIDNRLWDRREAARRKDEAATERKHQRDVALAEREGREMVAAWEKAQTQKEAAKAKEGRAAIRSITELDASAKRQARDAIRAVEQQQAAQQRQARAALRSITEQEASQKRQAREALSVIQQQQTAQERQARKALADITALEAAQKRQARELLNSILAAETAQRRQQQQGVQSQVGSIQNSLAQARAAVQAEQQRFNMAAGAGGSGVARGNVQQQLENAKGPILEIQRRLQVLQGELAKTLNPPQRNALHQQMVQLAADAQNLARNGFPALSQAVDRFSTNVRNSQTGMRGFFTRLRQELERINEVSLAANVQELSFRLAPLGLAAGALTLRGTQTKMELEEIRISFQAFTNNEREAVDLMGELANEARRFALPVIDTLGVMQRFSPLLRQAGVDLRSAINIAARLATLNPAQGIEGALFAMNEALAGQWRSLQTRFNLPTTAIRESIDDLGFVGGLDRFLNSLGRTTEFAERFGQTSRASFMLAQDAIDRFMAVGVESFVEGTGDMARMFAGFLNTLNETPNFVNQAVGALTILTTALYGVLGVLGQIGLASAGLRAVGSALKLSIATTPVGGAIAGGVGAVGGAAVGLAALTSAVAAGVAVGLGGAAALKVGGVNTGSFEGDLATQFERFKQILFTAVSAVAQPFFVGASVIGAAISLIGNALDRFATSLAEGVNNIAIGITEAVRSIGEKFNIESLKTFGGDPSTMRQNMQSRFVVTDPRGGSSVQVFPGMQAGSSEFVAAMEDLQSVAQNGQTIEFIEGYTERIQRLNAEFADFDLEDVILGALEEARKQLQFLWQGMFPPGSPGGPPLPPMGGNAPLVGQGGDLLDMEAIEKTVRSIGDLTANFSTEQARMMEDRAIQQSRALEDFWNQRGQQIADFYAQLAQAEEDYQRSRAERIADFNEQQQKAVEEYDDRRGKMQEDFQRDSLRRQEDFVRDMRRMSRDIGDALAARDFLSAQNIAQEMADEAEDFEIDRQRRQEDFDRQLAELKTALDEQQAERQLAFDRQLAREQEQHDRQVQRQIAAFNLQLQREDQQRVIAENRRIADQALVDRRRAEDFKRQYDMLVVQQQSLIDLHRWGMDGVSAVVRNAYLELGGFTIPNGGGGGGGGFGPGLAGFASGALSLPRDMMLYAHQGEMILPQPLAKALRDGDISVSGRDDSRLRGRVPVDSPLVGEMNIQIDARGLKDFDQREIVEMIADEVVEKMKEAMRRENELTFWERQGERGI